MNSRPSSTCAITIAITPPLLHYNTYALSHIIKADTINIHLIPVFT